MERDHSNARALRTVADGEESLTFAIELRPDVVLIDLRFVTRCPRQF